MLTPAAPTPRKRSLFATVAVYNLRGIADPNCSADVMVTGPPFARKNATIWGADDEGTGKEPDANNGLTARSPALKSRAQMIPNIIRGGD